MKSRRAVIGVALIALAFGVFWRAPFDDTPTAGSEVAPGSQETGAPMTAAREGPDAGAATAQRPVVTRTTSERQPSLGQFQEGFCSGEGDETIRVGRGLAALVVRELERRQRAPSSSDEAEETAVLQSALEPFEEGRSKREAFEAAARFERKVPTSRWPAVVMAMLAKANGWPDAEVAALRRFRALVPHEPAAGLALALATRTSPDLDEAIDGLTDFLEAEPSPGLSRLKARLEVQRDLQRDFSRRTRRGVTLLWPPGVITDVQAGRALDAVDRGLDDAAALTGTRRRETLTAIIYPGRSELLAVSCVPSWSGGLFDGSLRLIAAPTDSLGVQARALHHESLHAQLGPAAPNAPKWFHEGVAQSFARESAAARSEWALMVKNNVWVPFESLDGSFAIFEATEARLAYAQSLAMVELLRERCGSSAVPAALSSFQRGAKTSAALTAACGAPLTGPELIAHLRTQLERSAELE